MLALQRIRALRLCGLLANSCRGDSQVRCLWGREECRRLGAISAAEFLETGSGEQTSSVPNREIELSDTESPVASKLEVIS